HHQINQAMYKKINELIEQQYREQDATSFDVMISTYELKSNERDILSVTFSNYAMKPFAAHGLTFLDALTFNTQTGHAYTLKELFKPDSDYVQVLSEIVAEQIKSRDIPLLEPFTSINSDQFYY